jgi:cyclophilin family peptidyl-prolyl cis-trans isomerase
MFRVRPGEWTQFGIAGDPAIATAWRSSTIPDDPRKESNIRGTMAYVFKDPNGRTTQVFINLQDNHATHDGEPFVPFAKVIRGMGVADVLYAGYGEESGGGIRAGRQDPLFKGGNTSLKKNFPRLDYILLPVCSRSNSGDPLGAGLYLLHSRSPCGSPPAGDDPYLAPPDAKSSHRVICPEIVPSG